MKAFKYLLGVFALSALFVACEEKPGTTGGDDKKDPVTPPQTEEMPEVSPVEGKVVIVLNVAEEADVCNELAFAGNYNAYDLAKSVKFEPIEGFERWYKAEVTPNPSNEAIIGKPNQLNADGSFPSSWNYQWYPLLDEDGETVLKQVEVIEGDAEISKGEFGVEVDLKVQNTADVVYVRTYAWKENPCKPVEKAPVVFEATLAKALPDTLTLQIAGAMNDWGGTAMTPNDDRTVWTIELEAAIGHAYKYRAHSDASNLDYWELQATAEGKDCADGRADRKVDSDYMSDKVENLKDITITECKKEEETPAE